MKPETCLIVGAIVYFATIAVNRFLGERNYGSLGQDDKLKLSDAFSTHRSLATYIPVGILLVVIAVGYTDRRTLAVAFPIGVVIVLLVSLVLQISIFRRLTELSLPDDYVAKFRMQSTLVQIGNVVAISMLTYGIIARFV